MASAQSSILQQKLALVMDNKLSALVGVLAVYLVSKVCLSRADSALESGGIIAP